MSAPQANYWNPYAGGVVLGLVLLAAFVTAGRGLGASGAAVRVASAAIGSVAPAHAQGNAVYRANGGDEDGGSGNWLVIEVAGMILGGGLSAALAGRWQRTVERGAGVTAGSRLAWAFGGGAVMAIGARLARGCTSGQALSGGAVLSLGSWAFMLALFASAYAAARVTGRQWR